MSGKNKEKLDDMFKMLDNLAFESIDSLDVLMENQGVLFEAWKRVGEVLNDLVDSVARIEEAFLKISETLGCAGSCGSEVEVEDKKDSPKMFT